MRFAWAGLAVLLLFPAAAWPAEIKTADPGARGYKESDFPKLKQQGRTRAVGVANFNLALLKTVVEEIKVPIACNQIEYHVMLDQAKVARYLAAKSIPLVAYCPVAQGRAATDETLIAIGRKHNASGAQVALKWLLDQDGVAAIPKASRARICMSPPRSGTKISLPMRSAGRSTPASTN